MSSELTIHVVLYEQGPVWVAQALEYDIATQDRSLKGSLRQLIATITDRYVRAGARGGDPFAGVGRAPQRFHEMFEEADGEPMDFDIKPRISLPNLPVQPHLAARILEDCAA